MLKLILICAFMLVVAAKPTGNNKNCESTCEKTYPLHTYPSSEHLESCTRGCRLSNLIYYLNDGKENVKGQCSSACKEAYNQTFEQYACSIGCNNSDIAFKLHNKNESIGLVFHVHSMLGKMSGYISSTFVFYVSDEKKAEKVIAASKEFNAEEIHDLPSKSDSDGAWLPYQHGDLDEWFPKNEIPVACFYDFLHFLFFKIVVLFLLFLFIVTVLILMRITLFDYSKKKNGYVSYVESSEHLIYHDSPYPTTKMQV